MKINNSIAKTVFLNIISAILLIISMPPFFDIPFLGFVALVPAIVGLRIYKNNKLLIVFFGLIYSSFAYSWYVDIFSSIWGYILIIAVAFWHSRLIISGIKFESKLSSEFQVFALPLVYSVLEFIQRKIPYVKDWWFISYPKTSWGFEQGLWLLSVTGITGVTFLMILSNSTIAKMVQNKVEKKKNSKILFFNILLVLVYILFGFYYTNNDSLKNTYNIAVISDMANDMTGQTNEGLYVTDTIISDSILNENIKLSEQISDKADFIVWSENEFFNFYDKRKIEKLKKFANKSNSFLIVDSYMKTKEGLYDTAVMITPYNSVGCISKKRYLFSDEIKAGFIPSNDKIQSFMSDDIKVGLGVCYDFHFIDVVRNLAKDGAKIILMPRDDDMNRNNKFPYYHSTDAVFRAIENNVAIASANTNGASIVVDNKGQIKAYSSINQKSSFVGEISKSGNKKLYTKYGDWFGYILLIVFAIYILGSKYKRHIL